jgi:RNA polymerase sigma-70 factor (ECF subfamily)
VTDAELAAEAAAGNAEAFGKLIERHAPQIRRVTRAILSEPADADDAAQEAFLACWRYLGRYDPARPFGPWLIRIAVNAARDVRRRQRSRPTEPLAPDLALVQAGPDRRAARAELRESLNHALGELPERQRLAVVLFDAEGYSHREIAGMLGVAEGTVRSDVFHARRALRVALAPYEEESR